VGDDVPVETCMYWALPIAAFVCTNAMASSTSPQRCHDYLSCLQQEFERRSKDLSSLDRFSICLSNLKGEFKLLYLEIESLRKERDEYKERGMFFVFTVMELHC